MTEVSTPAKMTALAAYGERDEVQALAKRIMALHPSARAIGERGALLLAQLGVALGLNPLPGTGHIHAWVDKSGALCVHIGLEGRLALARKDSMYSFSTRAMRAEEVDLHSLKPGDRGAITELFRHDLTADMVRLGLPVKPVVGIGIAYVGEAFPKGRSLAWRAAQRSLKDAIRLAFSFSLPKGLPDVNFVESEGGVPPDIFEGEFSVDEDESAIDKANAASSDITADRAAQRARDKAALYGEPESEPQSTSTAMETPPPSTTESPPSAEAHSSEAVPPSANDDLPRTANPNQKTATVANDDTPPQNNNEQRARDKAALYGDDWLGDDSCAPTDPLPATEMKQPETEVAPRVPAPAEPKMQMASSYKDVKIKSSHWREIQIEIAKALPRYANKDGKPEPIHILNALAAQGVRLIDDNTTAVDLIAELKFRHQEETTPPREEFVTS